VPLAFFVNSLLEESVDVLDGNMLLYKAARVGNLAVMCEAIAMGGDKNWINHNDSDSTSLHQAAFSVSPSCFHSLIHFKFKACIGED